VNFLCIWITPKGRHWNRLAHFERIYVRAVQMISKHFSGFNVCPGQKKTFWLYSLNLLCYVRYCVRYLPSRIQYFVLYISSSPDEGFLLNICTCKKGRRKQNSHANKLFWASCKCVKWDWNLRKYLYLLSLEIKELCPSARL
jgi:hypothetical protein